MLKQIAIALLVLTGFTALPTAVRAQATPAAPGTGSAPSGPQPKIELENPVYDFGTALEGTTVKHSFKIKNVGASPLLVGGVKTSCGCTAAQPAKTNLAPGEETEIAAGVDTRFQKGHQVRTITVFSNDPATPQATMTIQGFVKQQVAATPAQVAFGKVSQGAEISRDVVISDLTGGTGFSVGNITNANPAIKVTRTVRTDGKAGVILKVSLLKTMPVGPFADTIKVATNREAIQVDVFGTVTGDLSVDPPQVSFGIVPRGQGAIRIIRLVNQGARPVKVTGVTTGNVAVSASAEQVTAGKQYKVTVELHRGTPDGQIQGQLHIATDDPNQQTLNVPFYGIIGQFRL
jgi:uncharacterized protein DUF1573/flagellar associated PapD-like protein